MQIANGSTSSVTDRLTSQDTALSAWQPVMSEAHICPVQGEMVQNKFGIPAVALRQLEIYTTAVLLATMQPPPAARQVGGIRSQIELLAVRQRL